MKIFLTTALSLMFLGGMCPEAMAQGNAGTQKPTPVIVSTVKEESFQDKVEAIGTLKANESIELTTTVTEQVVEINFEDGQRVNKGDMLLKMDTSEERAELLEQQSYLDEAERQVKRLTPLVREGAASASSMDEWKREVQVAEARINAIQSRIDLREIKAPYDGIVGLRNISVGALVQPGTLITTLDDDNIMKLDFSVPELFLASLKPGVEIEAVTKAYPGQIFAGTIASVDSRIDPATRSIQARALLDNPDGKLKPGLLMLVELQKNPRQTLVIPEEAVISEGAKSFVLVIERNGGNITASRRQVELGTRDFGRVEVLQGLKAGEQVVSHGTLRVRPGAPLKITAVEDTDQRLNELLKQNNENMAEEAPE